MREAGRRVLIVDDDASLREALTGLLDHKGFAVTGAATGKAALQAVGASPVELVLLDVKLGGENGLDVLPRLKTLRPEMSVIVITAAGSIETAVEAMRLGADNFIVKPLDPPRLLAVIEKGLESHALRRQSLRLERLSARSPTAMLGDSRRMGETLRMAEVVAGRDTTVLILGETGTGKGMLARRVHELSSRRGEPFVELNCAGLNRELTESELFGHERGAFTGATVKKIGLFEAADGGTLFLDEIGEMDLSVQAKLLNVLEERRFRRVGGVAEIEVDVRLVAATHRDLEQDVTARRFREDLFYRLNVFAIPLPGLRERREDILPLALHFFREFREGEDQEARLHEEAADMLRTYDWPGNVRELRNVMERAAIICPPGSRVLAEHLPPLRQSSAPRGSEQVSDDRQHDRRGTTMRDLERQLLETSLQAHGGNVQATARELGISRGTLYRKAKKYGIRIE